MFVCITEVHFSDFDTFMKKLFIQFHPEQELRSKVKHVYDYTGTKSPDNPENQFHERF